MKELGEQGSLIERFGSVKSDDVAHALIQAAKALKDTDDIQHGLKGGSIASVQLTSAAASKKQQGAMQEKAEKEAKERADDQMFLAMLQQQIDALNDEIDRTQEKIDVLNAKIDVLQKAVEGLQNGTLSIQDALENPEVADAVTAWEEKTGRIFDPDDEDAQEILTAIMEDRVDEFGNDVATLTQHISDTASERDRLVGLSEVAMAERRATGSISDATREEITATANGAATLITESQGLMDVDHMASGDRDKLSDNQFDTDAKVDNNDDGFEGLLGEMQGEVLDQFQSASAAPTEQSTPQLEQNPTVKPEMAG